MRLRFDDYVLDVVRHELWRGSDRVVIEPQVFDLLAYLAQNPDRVVSRDELSQAIWDGRIVSDSAIANRINAARRAIGDSGESQRLIRTVPRKGFRFVSQVAEAPVEAAANQVTAGCRRSVWRLAGAALAYTPSKVQNCVSLGRRGQYAFWPQRTCHSEFPGPPVPDGVRPLYRSG
jgi:DNA-binding winged helix-turn-helix (wHTH) protein